MITATKIVSTMSKRVRSLRAERGWSLDEVAAAAGMSKSYVWEIEKGRNSNPTIETTVKLARAFGVSVDYITGLETRKPTLHPEAMRMACEIDAIIRKRR